MAHLSDTNRELHCQVRGLHSQVLKLEARLKMMQTPEGETEGETEG